MTNELKEKHTQYIIHEIIHAMKALINDEVFNYKFRKYKKNKINNVIVINL